MKTELRHFILRAASVIAPPSLRTQWLQEWRSELWYVSPNAATAFCCGAFRDAFWLRRNHLAASRPSFLAEPAHCLVVLALLAGASGVLSFFLQDKPPFQETHPMPVYQGMAAGLAFYGILLVIALTFGDNPSWNQGLRGWIFLGLKLAFLLPMVYCAFILSIVLAKVLVLGQAAVIGGILLFRWAFTDQRRRCPVCLHLLSKPVRMGVASDTILNWFGSESICSAGHGLMQVGAGSTSFYGDQTWLKLDASWSGLFPKGRQ